MKLGLEVCHRCFIAPCYGTAVRAKEAAGVGAYQVIPAAHSGVSIKELCKVVLLESWTGIRPQRTLATTEELRLSSATREPVKVSHQGRNRGSGVLEKWLKQLCGLRWPTALLWNLGPAVEKGGDQGSPDCLETCHAGREESMLAQGNAGTETVL